MSDGSDFRGARTEYLEIMLRCRDGLNLPQENFVATHYCPDSMICMFRYRDGKLYRIEIKEIRPEDEGGTV